MTRLPVSILFFIVAGGLFAAQISGDLGIHLWRLGVAWWTAPLVSLGMAGLVIEPVLRRRVSRFWLAVPLIYVAGYAGLYAHDRLRVTRFEAMLAVGPVDFDLQVQGLLFEQADFDIASFQQDYRVPLIYTPHPEMPEGQYMAHRLVPWRACSGIEVSRDWSSWVRMERISRPDDPNTALCRISWRETPDVPVLRGRHDRLRNDTGVVDRWQFTLPGGEVRTIGAGEITALGPLPIPVLACWLDSGAPAWRCAARFRRNAIKVTPLLGPRKIAEILGLSRGEGRPLAMEAATVEARVATATDRMRRDHSMFLAAILAAPTGNAPRPQGWLRPVAAQRLDPAWLPGIVTALEAGTATGRVSENMRSLIYLLSEFEPAERAAFIPRLRAMIVSERQAWLPHLPATLWRQMNGV